MKNNRITGSVKKTERTQNQDWTISGQFDDNGFPDGNWKKDYKLDGNPYVDTEKYVHGLLVAKQTRNVSTGDITTYQFKDVNPQEYIAAYTPDKDSTIVDKLVCKEKIYYEQGENDESSLDLLPEVFGVEIRSIVEKIKEVRGFGSEQEVYESIPFKKIVIVNKIETQDELIFSESNVRIPTFPGGVTELMKYITEKFNYSKKAQDEGIHGRVIVSFIIDCDGSISDAKIVRGLNPECDNAVIQLINGMPRWIPGQKNGKNIRVTYTVPIKIPFIFD